MKTLALGLIAMGAALAAASAPAAPLLVNGSFEDGPELNSEGYYRGGLPTGWSAVPGGDTPDIIGNAYNQTGAGIEQLLHAQDGTRFLDMNGAGTSGALRQDVTGITPGSSVEVTFWVSRWAQNSADSLLAVLYDAQTLAVLGGNYVFYSYDPVAQSSSWVQYSMSGVVGASGGVRVAFFGSNGRGAAPGLDNVVLTAVPGAVPEPASWAMMIAGFGIVGGAMRSRYAGGSAAA